MQKKNVKNLPFLGKNGIKWAKNYKFYGERPAVVHQR